MDGIQHGLQVNFKVNQTFYLTEQDTKMEKRKKKQKIGFVFEER